MFATHILLLLLLSLIYFHIYIIFFIIIVVVVFDQVPLSESVIRSLSPGALQAGFHEANAGYLFSPVPQDGWSNPVVKAAMAWLVDGTTCPKQSWFLFLFFLFFCIRFFFIYLFFSLVRSFIWWLVNGVIVCVDCCTGVFDIGSLAEATGVDKLTGGLTSGCVLLLSSITPLRT